MSSRHVTMLAASAGPSPIGPSQHIALPHKLGRYRRKADVVFVESRGRFMGTRPSVVVACAPGTLASVTGGTGVMWIVIRRPKMWTPIDAPARTVPLPLRHDRSRRFASDVASQATAAATIHAVWLLNKPSRRLPRSPQRSAPCPRRSTSADDRLR
jgi:hypothetical protein